MDKMIQYRYNRIKYLVRMNLKKEITTEEMWKQVDRLRNEIYFLESLQ